MSFNFFNTDSGLYTAAEWITRLIYLNLLWIIFTLLGFLVVGIMPATLSVFVISKSWLSGENDIKAFKCFWKNYKKYFLKINSIGFIMVIIGAVLLIDINYFSSYIQGRYLIIKYIFYFLFFIYSISYIYIFPITIRYEISKKNILKNSLFFIVLSPKAIIKMLISLFFLVLLFRFLPSLLLFLGVSLPVFIISWILEDAIKKIEKKVKEV